MVFLQAVGSGRGQAPPVRLRLDRSWAKCPGNMAKHGQIMAMAPGQGDPPGQPPWRLTVPVRAACQAALGAPRPSPGPFTP